MPENDAKMLIALEFHSQWLSSGALQLEELHRHYIRFVTEGMKYPEHQRINAFRKLLGRINLQQEGDIKNYIELAALDGDRSVGLHALVCLINSPSINEKQLSLIEAKLSSFEPLFQKHFQRRRLLNHIVEGPIDDNLVLACMASRDDVVQRALLRSPSLTRDHVAIVAIDGCNRAVRNIAKQLLGRR